MESNFFPCIAVSLLVVAAAGCAHVRKSDAHDLVANLRSLAKENVVAR